jgi:hypothetical protein
MKQPERAPTERIRAIQDEMQRFERERAEAQKTVSTCEGEMIDLEHEIELAPLNRVELRKCAERLRDVRQTRRRAKDKLETLSEIMRILDKTGAIRAVDEAVRAAAQADRNRETREYRPRVRPQAAAANQRKNLKG